MSEFHALEGLVVKSNLEHFKKMRKAFGSQNKAATALGYYDQSLISLIETGKTTLCDRTYTLMLLIAKEHPKYELKVRKIASDWDQLVVDSPKSLGKTSFKLVAARKKANLTVPELAVVMSCAESTITHYEDGNGPASNRFYTTFLFVMQEHPYFFLVNKE